MADIAKDGRLSPSEWVATRGPAFSVAGSLSPSASVLLLIALTAVLRLAFAGLLSLTIDEQYMVAAGRRIQWGYFDHPPAAWWLSWAASHLTGSEAPIVVRAPFVLLFGLSTWLMYRLCAFLFSERAGVWAALLMNLAPIIGVAAAGWVGPDGPLMCALLGAALCLAHALFGPPADARRWWVGAGLCAGAALFSKYTACLTIGGVVAYLLTQRDHRRWLLRVEPYMAAGLAGLVFAPVVIWNARHGWASFDFQGGRAAPEPGLSLLSPLEVLGGGALFILPHLWLGLIAALAFALRTGPGEQRTWLMFSLASPPIVFFAFVSLWNAHVMFHWSSPGYLMAMPLLGAVLDAKPRGRRLWAARIAAWTGVCVLAGCALYAAETRWNWAPEPLRRAASSIDPNVESGDWTSIQTTFARRGYLRRPNLVFGAIDWRAAAKLNYLFGGTPKVVGLGDDLREYRFQDAGPPPAGADVLITALDEDTAGAARAVRGLFDRLEAYPPAPIIHAGRITGWAPLLLGHGYRDNHPTH